MLLLLALQSGQYQNTLMLLKPSILFGNKTERMSIYTRYNEMYKTHILIDL